MLPGCGMARLSRGAHALPPCNRLNGGPGCSSFDGALIELGPLRIDENGAPRVVEGTAWNEYANVLFRKPGCIPFSRSFRRTLKPILMSSRSTRRHRLLLRALVKLLRSQDCVSRFFPQVTKNDNVRELADAADQVVNFLANFYRVFPEFGNMDTFIAGESYAGQYIPYIADAIQKTTIVNTPLKGLLIGNGWISPREQYPAYLDYLVDQRLVKKNSQAYRNVRTVLDKCEEKLMQIEKDNGGKGMVLVGECEQILGAIGAATGRE